MIHSAADGWEPTIFLVDSGADCTVFSAAVLDVLGFDASVSTEQIGGIGGVADSVTVSTRIRFPIGDGGSATFRGDYSAFTQLEALDTSVLGRDILRMFAVIIDCPGDVVSLVREPHRYVIETA